jgi:hypothetical protein
MHEETRSPFLMNPILKLSIDKLGITVLIIKHGECIQQRAFLRQSLKGIDYRISITQANFHAAMADLNISDVAINSKCESE